jgi:trans-aconitate methyltransferase
VGPPAHVRGRIVIFVATADTPWEDADNARRYAQFARRYPMYRLTSEHLVGLAVLAPDARVVDLCCGTGVTTEAVLAVLGARGTVVAVDSAAAMLAEARSRVVDERVRWVRGHAENLTAGPGAGVDAVVCNQAFWQTDMLAASVAVRGVLRVGGRLVFNVGAQMLADRPEAGASEDPLTVRMREIAAREHGRPASAPRSERHPARGLSEGAIRDLLARAGLRVDGVRELRWEQSLEERYAWLTVPVFARHLQRLLDGLPYPECMTVLAKAYRDIADVHPEPRTATALAFAATMEHASGQYQ